MRTKIERNLLHAALVSNFKKNKGHLSLEREERLQNPMDCQCCGYHGMKNAIVFRNKSGTEYRVGRTCAVLIQSTLQQ